MNENLTTLETLVAALNERDLEKLSSVFSEDVVLEWPQFNERIVGNANRREIYARFPALPTVSNHRISGAGDHLILEADLDYGDGPPWFGIFLFTLSDARITREVGYWAQPSPGAEWRAPWVEPIRS